MHALLRRSPAVGLALVIAACGGGDGFSPTTDNVAGSYSATAFTVTTAAGTLDLLALGAHVNVVLNPNGTTTGQLFVPGAVAGGADINEDLTGTWSLSGSTVTFNQTADTFIRDAPFTVTSNHLTGDGTFSGQAIHVVLTKSP